MANPDPFAHKELDEQEHAALKALHAGEATPHQQRLALAIIVNNFSRAHDLLYIPNSFDATGFVNGRAFVGQRILKYLNLPVGKIQQEKTQ